MQSGARDGAAFASSVERGLQLSIGAVVVVKTLVFVLGFGAWVTTAHQVVAALIVALVTAAAWRCLRARAGRLDVAMCAVAMVASFALPDARDADAGAAASPIIHLVEPLLLAVAVGGRAFFALTVLTVDVTYIGLRALDGGDGLLAGLQEATFITGVAVAVHELVTRLRAASERAEAALQDHRTTSAEAADRADLEATTFVHDELVPTLLAASMAPDRPGTRRAAEQALRRLVRPRRRSGVERPQAAVAELAARAGVEITVHVVGASGPVALPLRVREAIEGAMGEALRNVARHSGVTTAHVQIVQGPWSTEVVIRDDGRGFGPVTEVEGVGLRSSILDRMRSVGGSAAVVSRPGSGTEVRLRWAATALARRRSMADENDQLLRVAVGDPGGAVGAVCAWLATGYVLSALLLIPSDDHGGRPFAMAVPLLLLTAGMCAALRRGPLRAPWLVAASLVPAAALMVVLPLYPSDELGTLHTWIIELSSLPVVAAAWTGPPARLAAMLLPSALTVTVVGLDAGISGAEVPHLLLIAPLNVTFVAVIAAMLRRTGRAVVAAEEDDSTTVDLPRRLRHLLGGEYGAICAALGDQAAGRVDARRAERLAHAARDCLYLRGDQHAALRHALDLLRAGGVVVRTTNREAPAQSRPLADALTRLAEAPPSEVAITSFRDRVSVVVQPAPDAAALAAIADLLGDAWTVEDLDGAAVLGWRPGVTEPAEAGPGSDANRTEGAQAPR